MTTQHSQFNKRRAAGFTIVELLVVIAILFVLIGLVMVALRTGRRAATRTESLNALRQMTNAYNVYATEHKGRLMPGFVDPDNLPGQNAPPPAPNELDLRAKLRTGYLLNEGDTSSYVWRLAPYLDHNWDIYMTDYRNAQLVAALESEYGNGDGTGDAFGAGSAVGDQFGIARVPSFGLNSIYLGGDNFHVDESLSPWTIGADVQNNPATIAAVRLSMVKNPGKIIVFGACRSEGLPDLPAYGDSALGYCELRAPYANFDPATQTGSELQWTVDASGQAILEPGQGPAGLPISRLEDERVPISHLDGSTEAEYIHRLAEDMSRWSPNALSSN